MVVEALGGGVFTYVSQLSNDLSADFDVYVAYATRSQTPENFKDFFNPNVNLVEVKKFGNLKNIFSDIKVIKELRRIEEEIKPDIIHLHSSIAGGFGRLAFKGKNNTVIYTPHGYSYLMVGENTFMGKMYKTMEKFLGKKNCITLTCCKSEEEEAKKFSENTAYIETGVNLADLSASLDNVYPVNRGEFTVYTLGRICIQKQPQLFNQIAMLTPEAKFIWIGVGELKDELKAPNIEITGWKPRKDALALAKGADIFILCSLGEAIAMSLIEMMFIKKLCLVSNVVGNKDVIKNGINGYVCNKAEEYSARIKQAIKEYPIDLPKKAYEDVLNIYNTNSMKEKYVQFYSNVDDGKYNK
jgi:glycosyltransferase involved in cell wall biosynthesis